MRELAADRLRILFVVPRMLIAGIVIFTVSKASAASPNEAGYSPDFQEADICNRAIFEQDVTVQDGTAFDPETPFTKVWQLRNGGTCTWTTGYEVVFIEGDQLGAPDYVRLGTTVVPGQSVEISVEMVAPSTGGSYRGVWMLRDTSGALFGVGEDASTGFWVQIFVTGPTATAEVTNTIEPTPTFTIEPTSSPTPSPPAELAEDQEMFIDQGSAPDQPVGDPEETSELVEEAKSIEEVAYRQPGQLVSEISIYIPTPLDISFDPVVIGTNLALAALLMLPFAVAAESFSQILAKRESRLQERVRPLSWIANFQEWVDQKLYARLDTGSAKRSVFKVLCILAFYGVVFSLLDRTWDPLSVRGVVLFLSMMIAYGLVGLLGDIINWRKLCAWGYREELCLRPSNIFLAVISTAATRVFSIIPGIMFGTPEALQTEGIKLTKDQRRIISRSSLLAFTGIGLGTWGLTALTRLISSRTVEGNFCELLFGFEALLLIIFAVALENVFVKTLGVSGGFGREIRSRNRFLWFVIVVAVSFLLFHTLLNPRGDLYQAFQLGNVRFFILVVVIFIVSVIVLNLVIWARKRGSGEPR